MSTETPIDDLMDQFRLASRELFNHYFRVPDPYNNDGWDREERFSKVEAVLFEKLVLVPAQLADVQYGLLHPEIRVRLRDSSSAPIMINRDIDSGYWDYPVTEVTKETELLFVRYFDWDQLGYRDNRFVRVQIHAWPARPDTVGRSALVDSNYVRFVKVRP